MAEFNPQDWITFLSIGSNVALLVSAAKIVRNLSRMELKVDTMWGVFMRKFGTRGEDTGIEKAE